MPAESIRGGRRDPPWSSWPSPIVAVGGGYVIEERNPAIMRLVRRERRQRSLGGWDDTARTSSGGAPNPRFSAFEPLAQGRGTPKPQRRFRSLGRLVAAKRRVWNRGEVAGACALADCRNKGWNGSSWPNVDPISGDRASSHGRCAIVLAATARPLAQRAFNARTRGATEAAPPPAIGMEARQGRDSASETRDKVRPPGPKKEPKLGGCGWLGRLRGGNVWSPQPSPLI